MIKLLLFTLLLALSSCSLFNRSNRVILPPLQGTNLDPSNVWPTLSMPTNGEADSIGGYSSGCLLGGQQLPSRAGILIAHPERKRDFGHPHLVGFLQRLSQQVDSKLLIGDLSQPRGGPIPGGHASHQNGLDVDLYYKLGAGNISVTMINKDGLSLAANVWKEEYEVLLMKVAAEPRVERIFVNAVIKKELCKKYPDNVLLSKIRPWYYHDEHFHIRLACPENSSRCVVQNPVGKGSQCGSELAWWFSSEALDIWRQWDGRQVERSFSLPEACRSATL